MKKLFAAIAMAMGIATGAEAVTTNRVTVLNKSGSATSEGSLAYWIKNAPINGNVLELTLMDDPQEPESGTYGGTGGYMLDEPLTILSGQKIIVRCVPNPGSGTLPGYERLERVTGGQGYASGGPLVEITGALGAACDAQGKSPFTIQSGGFLRFERVSLANWGDGIDYYMGQSMFANSGALELAHCCVWHYHNQVQGGILRSYTGSTTLFYCCTFCSSIPKKYQTDPSTNPTAVDGAVVYCSGGRFTMVNSEGPEYNEGGKNGFYFTGSETESLFLNCKCYCGFMYDNIADGKHHIIGTILGWSKRLKWDEGYGGFWANNRDVPWYQVECSGSGKPVIRDCVIMPPGSGDGGNIFPTSWEADLVGCIEKETDLTPGGNELSIAEDLYGSYFEPWVNRACNIYALDKFTPFPYLSTGAAGAQIWHDAEWRNVVGEDTERFVIRGDATKATQRLDEDFLGKPISADHRPVPQHIQWNEPTLTVDASGPGIAMSLAYRFMLSENYDESHAMLGGANLLWGRTTLQDAVEYAVEDWRRGAGNRRLIGADGAYHINFADNLKGKTVSVHGVMRVRDGIKIVIDGEGTTLEVGEPDLGVEGASRIFDVSGGELVLSNLTLKGGCADGSWIFNPRAPSEIRDDVCEGGAIRVGGGTLLSGYGVEGKVTVDNCRFEDCTAKNAGGAIYVNGDYCSATVRNSSFVRCGLTDPSSGSGGAIFVGGSTGAGPSMGLVVENCNFAACGGSAANSDAVHIGKRSEVEMTGVVIADGENGGVYVDDSARSVAITDSTIFANGGYDISGAVVKIEGGNVRYGDCSGVIWAEGSEKVNPEDVLVPSGWSDIVTNGVEQVRFWDVGESGAVDLPFLTGDTVLANGAVARGALAGDWKLAIANCATVTLQMVTIEGVNDSAYEWAGLTCLGDATIILEGENYVKGFWEDYPGIYVPPGSTLTIMGGGSLIAESNGYGAGIGDGYNIGSSGRVVIESGTVTAKGGTSAAGIGSGEGGCCGGVVINGGTVVAIGGDYAAGIGSGELNYLTCGNIVIGPDVVRVEATCGSDCDNPIGEGADYTGGAVSVSVGSGLIDVTDGATRTIRRWDGNLSTLEGDARAFDGTEIRGRLWGNHKVSVVAGATVTLDDAVISGANDGGCRWAGLTCEGDATIVLEGENEVKGFHEDYPGIYVPAGATLAIRGGGSLVASSNGKAAGIGGGNGIACGAISVGDGVVRVVATCGGGGAAPIGAGGGGSGGAVDVGDTLLDGTSGSTRTIAHWDGNLATLGCDATAVDGLVIYGVLGGNYKVSVADGAKVWLRYATIDGVDDAAYGWAGLTCGGDATIVIAGTNSVTGFRADQPGISVLGGGTLSFKGDGLLAVRSNGGGEAIAGTVSVDDSLSDLTVGGTRIIQRACDLAALKGDRTLHNLESISGTLGGISKICIADGATVVLKDVTIDGVADMDDETGQYYEWAGLTCLGDATIVLVGANSVKGFAASYPGIYVPRNKTLTIRGLGSLSASSNGGGAGIGGGWNIDCGNIVIEGGTISATGGANAAGIGSGDWSACGTITISGGTVTATGGENAAGIGCGCQASCGNIAIGAGITRVTATKGDYAYYPIGQGYQGSAVVFTTAPGVINLCDEDAFTWIFEGSGPASGFAAWAAGNGLSGADAAWDAKPAKWNGWANAFIYTYGEGLADGSVAIMSISFGTDGKPIITTTPVIEGHTDFTPSVIGSSALDSWASPVILNHSGDNWALPSGYSANFFRVRLTE